MKIALFTDTFYPKIDGVVTSTINLAQALTEVGHQVLIVAPRPANFLMSKFTIPGVEILWLRSLPTGFYPDLRMALWTPKFHRFLIKWRADLVHVMTPMTIGLMGLTHAKFHQLPLVMTFHTYFMEPEYLRIVKIKNDKASQKISHFGWQSVKLFYNKAHAIIVPSSYVASDLHQRDFKPPIYTIPSGIRLSVTLPLEEQIEARRKKYHLGHKKVLLTVGRVSEEKNYVGLLRIFAQIHRDMPETHLLIIGGGPALATYKNMVHQLKLKSAVTFLGEISHQNLLKQGYYYLGHLFVTASLSETQGMSVLEAQAHHLPVVAYQARGLSDVIGTTDFLCESNDESCMAEKIIVLLSDEKKIKQAQKQIKKNLSQFDLKNTTAQLIKVYQDLSLKDNLIT